MCTMAALDFLAVLLLLSYPLRVSSYLSFMGKEFYLGFHKLTEEGFKDLSAYEFFLTTFCDKNEVTIYRWFKRVHPANNETDSNSTIDLPALSQITEVLPLHEMVPSIVFIKSADICDPASTNGLVCWEAAYRMLANTTLTFALYAHTACTILIANGLLTSFCYRDKRLVHLAEAGQPQFSPVPDDVDVGMTESYSLVGLENFALSVMIMMDQTSVDMFMAVPVEAWGKSYYVTTLKGQPFIQIVSASNKNTVSALLRLQGKANITYGSTMYGDGATLAFILDRGEAFAISKCKNKVYLSMTGTKITGRDKVGVISGNCASRGSTVLCNNMETVHGALTRDTVAEMMFPVEAHGTDFVLIDVPQRFFPGYYLIVADEETQVNIYITRTNIKTHSVKKVLHLENPGCCKLIKSFEPVQITYVQLPACVKYDGEHLLIEEHLGDASMTLLVPNALFYVLYIWRTPDVTPNDLSFVRVVVPNENIAQLVLDGKDVIKNLNWSIVPESEHQIGVIHIAPGNHKITGKKFFRFGCYIYGMAHQMMYMHPAGFQDCNPVHKIGDLFDNDCDGRFDEEILDKKDNDGDNNIDEDVAKEKQECPSFSWGDHCKFSCENCVGDCNKKSGACSSCANGFKRAMFGCTKECESNEFGANCGESCEEKCGGDCKNKKTGECFTEHKTGIKTVLLLIPIVIFLCCVLISKKKRHSSNTPRKSRDRSQIGGE